MRAKLIVLLADDDAVDRELLRHAISRDGVNVELHEVQDGDEVINYLQGAAGFEDRAKNPMPDLLLLDLKMPRMDGLTVLDWLKSHQECGRIPTVLLSGSGLEKDVTEAYQRGVNTYFAKRGNFEQMKKLIRLVVDYWANSEPKPAPHNC